MLFRGNAILRQSTIKKCKGMQGDVFHFLKSALEVVQLCSVTRDDSDVFGTLKAESLLEQIYMVSK